MTGPTRKKVFRYALPITLLLVVLLAVGYVVANRFVAHYVRGPKVLKMIGGRSAQKLEGRAGYLPLTSHGLSFFSPGFVGTAEPPRALSEIRASQIFARCDLLELWRGKWSIDSLRIDHLQVAFGKTAAGLITRDEFPTPELEPPATTESILSVDVRQTTIGRFDLFWADPKNDGGQFRNVRADFVTQGKNLIVQGNGGTFRKGKFPQMQVERFKIEYTKPELQIDEGKLSVGGKGEIAVSGGMRFEANQSMKLALKFEACPIAPFLSEAQRSKVAGSFDGTSAIEKKPGENNSISATGSVAVNHGVLQHFAALEQAATFTGKSELNPLRLDEARASYDWNQDRLEVREVVLERKKIICVKGRAALRGQNLEGTFQLGLAPEIVEKFPGAREEVFERSEGGYLWTPVKLSGTMSNPRTDLKERLLAAVEHHFAKGLLAPLLHPGKSVIEAIGALFQ